MDEETVERIAVALENLTATAGTLTDIVNNIAADVVSELGNIRAYVGDVSDKLGRLDYSLGRMDATLDDISDRIKALSESQG